MSSSTVGGNDENLNRKLSIFKHRKKQAANDAQLLMNRIALLQKEEERARKKIDQTKERAEEIINMRSDHEKRIQSYVDAAIEEKDKQKALQQKNKDIEQESKKARSQQASLIHKQRRDDVSDMIQEKKKLTVFLLKEQERELKLKQKRREEVLKAEEAARARKQREQEENDRKVREYYEKKAALEESEAAKAEKLVRSLEKKEREWMDKLRNAQGIQEMAFEHLEEALIRDPKLNGTGDSLGSSDGKKKLMKKPSSAPKLKNSH